MHFFSIRKAAIEIRDDRLSEWEITKYYIGAGIFSALVSAVQRLLFDAWASEGRALGHLLCIPVIYFYVAKLFRENSSQGGRSFINRIVVLGFPATVRTLFVYCFVFSLASSLAPENSQLFLFLFDSLANPACYAILFWQINLGLKVINA